MKQDSQDKAVIWQTLQNNLVTLRGKHGLTQRQVAEALGVDRSTYTYYELGKRMPNIVVVYQLARFYQVPIDSLFPKYTV